MSVSERDVRHIAALARVALDTTRIPQLVTELNGILGHMDVLQQVTLNDATNTTVLPGESMPLRSDGLPADALHRTREAFAPNTRDGFFLVPRLATHENLGSSADSATDAGGGATRT